VRQVVQAAPELSQDQSEAMGAVVKARGLVKYYGDFPAVAGIDFHIAPGEFFGMLGPNGAGKSTTMRMVYRVTPLSAGELSVLGFKAGRDDRLIKAELGVVPQVDNLDEELNVLDNLLDGLASYGLPTPWTVGMAHPGEEEPQVVVDLSNRSHAGTRVMGDALLVYGDSGGKPIDVVHVRLVHAPKELPGIG